MAIRTVLKALWQSPAGPLLLSAQVALSLMIFANVAYVIDARLEATESSTAMNLADVFWVQSYGAGADYDQQSTVKFDLEYLKLLPGVIAACVINEVPQMRGSLRSLVSPNQDLKKNKRAVFVYQSTDAIIDVLGLRLVRGRMFNADSVLPAPPRADVSHPAFGAEVVITEDLATKLYGTGERALGQPMYFSLLNGGSATVVGVVELMQAAPSMGPGDIVYDVVLTSAVPPGPNAIYLVRTKPGQLNAVMARVWKELEPLQHGRLVNSMDTLANRAAQSRVADRTDAVILAILSSLVLAVTMLGLFGFASFAVTSRTKEIGTRRAIGARRVDIVKMFLLENWLITSTGIVIGSVITLVFAVQLHVLLELPRMPI
ncbi:MAG TPA: FtsX-like permease family protein, partial [Steroidobacteraceae bacterium]|nr:FtsX-like permease family protein [Steroidobacteraceae bacterium]